MKQTEKYPWRLQYQWKNPIAFEKYCIRASKDFYTPKWFNGAGKYNSLEHAKKKLYREFIDPYFDAIVGGRNWRIFNKETQESFTVIIEAKSITLI